MSEQIFIDRTTTWHAIGKDVQECKSMEQVLRASGLDYEVMKKPIFTSMVDGGALVEVPNRFMTVNSRGKIYDVVSDKFRLVQNREAFEFVDYMGDELSFEKAGGNRKRYGIHHRQTAKCEYPWGRIHTACDFPKWLLWKDKDYCGNLPTSVGLPEPV